MAHAQRGQQGFSRVDFLNSEVVFKQLIFPSLNTANFALLVELLVLSLLDAGYDMLQLVHDTILI